MSLYDDLQGKSDEELVRMIGNIRDDHPDALLVRRILDGRNSKRQLEISTALVHAATSPADLCKYGPQPSGHCDQAAHPGDAAA